MLATRTSARTFGTCKVNRSKAAIVRCNVSVKPDQMLAAFTAGALLLVGSALDQELSSCFRRQQPGRSPHCVWMLIAGDLVTKQRLRRKCAVPGSWQRTLGWLSLRVVNSDLQAFLMYGHLNMTAFSQALDPGAGNYDCRRLLPLSPRCHLVSRDHRDQTQLRLRLNWMP